MRGLRQRFRNRLLFAARAPAPDGFGGKDHERDPNEDEGNQVRAGEWLVIQKDAEKKTTARRKVLEKADRGEAEMARGDVPGAINSLGLGIVGPTLIAHGTDWRFLNELKKELKG